MKELVLVGVQGVQGTKSLAGERGVPAHSFSPSRLRLPKAKTNGSRDVMLAKSSQRAYYKAREKMIQIKTNSREDSSL